MLSTLLVGVCRAQGSGSGYFYPIQEAAPGYLSGYQWRPSADQPSSNDVNARSLRGRAELLTGRSQLQLDPPPGGYRPIKEALIPSPQMGSYHFRHVSPEKRSHYATTESETDGVRRHSNPAQLRFRGGDSGQNLWSPGTQYQPRFRPDEKFSSGVGRSAAPNQQYKPPTYSEPIYSAPVFREGAHERR